MGHGALADVAVCAVPSDADRGRPQDHRDASRKARRSPRRSCSAGASTSSRTSRLPRYVEFRAELPRSPVGRVLKRTLARRRRDRDDVGRRSRRHHLREALTLVAAAGMTLAEQLGYVHRRPNLAQRAMRKFASTRGLVVVLEVVASRRPGRGEVREGSDGARDPGGAANGLRHHDRRQEREASDVCVGRRAGRRRHRVDRDELRRRADAELVPQPARAPEGRGPLPRDDGERRRARRSRPDRSTTRSCAPRVACTRATARTRRGSPIDRYT